MVRLSVRQVLPGLHGNELTEWNLSGKISKVEALILASALARSNTLQHLKFDGENNIGVEGVITLASALARNNTLQQLNLEYNRIFDEGVIALAGALGTNKALKILDLKYTSVGYEGAKALAEVLATNTTLQQLNLYHNNIGVKGAIALAGALGTNRALKILDLGCNDVRDEGAKAFASVLVTNNTLQQLDLYCNGDFLFFGMCNGAEGAKYLERNIHLNKVEIAYINFFLRLNRKGRNNLFTPTPIPLYVWTEVAGGPPGIMYYLLRQRAGLLTVTSNHPHNSSEYCRCVASLTSS